MKIKFTHLTMLGLAVLLTVNVNGQISNTSKQIVADTTNSTATKSTVGGGAYLLGYAWDMNGTSIYYNEGKVGIGTNSPGYQFEVNKNYSGWLTRFYNASNNSRAYFGNSTGNGAFISAGTNSTASTYALQVRADNYTDPFLFVRGDGKIGMGTSNPVAKLELISYGSIGSGDVLNWNNSALRINQQGYLLGFDGNQITANRELFITSQDPTKHISFQIYRDTKMKISGNGNVGIGTTNPTSKLTVKGEIKCSKVRVVDISNIPDYVFEEEYDLMEIEEVEKYISDNKHLPEIPSASEFMKTGMDIVEMNKLLLKKLEEQTLYIIEMNKRIKKLEGEMQ